MEDYSFAEVLLRRKISVIVACYKDAQAIEEIYQRLKQLFLEIKYDWELIVVDDASPDNSSEIIQKLSEDRRVVGIRHTRNFGSQAAFLSGLTMVTGDAFVFMDGDLQDPPEVIGDFIKKWEDGYDVVYGIRAKREGPLYFFFQKIFYLLFSKMSSFHIPLEVGDFALMDIRMKDVIDKFSEKNIFLRTIRSYIGLKQGEVKYFRPKRKYGKSTNSVFKYLSWAMLAFMSIPYNAFKFFFVVTMIVVLILLPFSLMTALLLFFNGIGVLLIGIFVRFILMEVKNRPLYIQEYFIKNGKISKL
jgi:dolichol-phosphate mannosyltransferase